MINCIIVDDEPHCVESLTKLILQVPEKINLLETFTNPTEALQYVHSHNVDLVFSDIKMPLMSGVEFTAKVGSSAKVIFATAHEKFGPEAYENNVIDYLMKPIEYSRFLQAINKAFETINQRSEYLFIKDGHKKVNVKIADIVYLEASKGYIEIHKKNIKEPILSLNSLNDVEKQLKSHNFYRIHNSHIVSLAMVETFDSNYVLVNTGPEKKNLPISDTYRQKFFSAVPMLGR